MSQRIRPAGVAPADAPAPRLIAAAPAWPGTPSPRCAARDLAALMSSAFVPMLAMQTAFYGRVMSI